MKNKKILKIVLITVLLMLITFAIWFIRKFIIMNKIAKASEKWNNATNYSLEFNQREAFGEYYTKDGKYLFIMNTEDEKGAIKEGVVCWYDDETKEYITIDKVSNNTTVSISTSEEAMRGFGWIAKPNVIVENNFMAKIKAIFEYKLKIEDIDGKECYTVMSKYTDTKQCHDKESGLPIKIICNANSEDEANKSYIIYKDWKFNEVDDKEVIRPDTTKYNVD